MLRDEELNLLMTMEEKLAVHIPAVRAPGPDVHIHGTVVGKLSTGSQPA